MSYCAHATVIAQLIYVCRFQTYFPHVDNIYSHRSTQRYKRKPFVSHYWDCRLKGRPPGTAKSNDPNKKKRKRQARERDLCDVKIKITEFFPGARALLGTDFPVETPANDNPFAPGRPSSNQQNSQPLGALRSNDQSSEPGNDGARYYTIQRVNGNGANGKGDGTAGSHKHTIEESDKVKKSSIHRYFIKEEKERRKSLVSLMHRSHISFLEPQASFQSSNELPTSTCMRLVRKRSPSSSPPKPKQ